MKIFALLIIVGASFCSADVGVHSAGGVSSLPVYGSGHQSTARDSRLIQIAVIPASRSQIRGRSIADLHGFVDHQKLGGNFRIEPINLDDKDHLLFPDQFAQLQQLGVAKDSYGNPVTPFPLTNDELKLRAGDYKVDKNGFVIPNYADGITDIHDPHLPRLKKPNSDLLPPFSADGNIYYPGVKATVPTLPADSTPDQSANDLLQPPTLPVIPDVPAGSQQPSLIEIPSDALLPPLETNEFESKFNQPLDINVVPQIPTITDRKQPEVLFVPFAAPNPVPTQAAPSTTAAGQKYTGGFGFNGNPNTIIAQGVDDNNKYTGAFLVTSNTGPTQVPSISTSLQTPHLTTGNKFTGSFLNPTVPVPTRFGDVPPTLGHVPTTTTKGNKYTGGFGYSNVNIPASQPVGSASQQLPQVQQQQLPLRQETNSNVQKYTGGFGGPPGLLVPFDHIHTYARVDDEQ